MIGTVHESIDTNSEEEEAGGSLHCNPDLAEARSCSVVFFKSDKIDASR